MLSHVAPAGTRIELADLVSGVAGAWQAPGDSDDLAAELRNLTGLPHAWPVSSGRAAMTTILKVMKDSSRTADRDEVVIPAYTCYSVPAAVERAGLLPRLCDVDPATLAMDPAALERCDFSRVLAVVTSNLYGIPDDLPAIEAICGQQGVYLLDDAAQALGASVGTRPAGTFGDAGLYSFDKGKIISTMQGGAIVAREGELSTRFAEAVASLPVTPMATAAALYGQLIVYAILLRPVLYGLVQRLPGTGLGTTVYDTHYPLARLASLQVGVAISLLRRLSDMNGHRRARADLLAAAVAGMQGVECVAVPAGSIAVFPRYPLRITPAGLRQRALAALVSAGIGATGSYPRSLADVPQVMARLRHPREPMPGARAVAESIVTLPTHDYCPPGLPSRVGRILGECG